VNKPGNHYTRLPLAGMIAFAFLTVLFGGKTRAKAGEGQFGSLFTDTLPSTTPLNIEIARMDSLLFHAFNTRDLEAMKQFFDTGIEVYQDNIGMRNYSEAMGAFAGVFKKDYVLTRTLVPGSMEVYPIKDYGAIETGLHTFSHVENGKPESTTFKFMHIWRKQNGKWKITRLITYNH
jgi:ketosteroid isomerase-like protein